MEKDLQWRGHHGSKNATWHSRLRGLHKDTQRTLQHPDGPMDGINLEEELDHTVHSQQGDQGQVDKVQTGEDPEAHQSYTRQQEDTR